MPSQLLLASGGSDFASSPWLRSFALRQSSESVEQWRDESPDGRQVFTHCSMTIGRELQPWMSWALPYPNVMGFSRSRSALVSIHAPARGATPASLNTAHDLGKYCQRRETTANEATTPGMQPSIKWILFTISNSYRSREPPGKWWHACVSRLLSHDERTA